MTLWNWITDTLACLCLFAVPVLFLWASAIMGWGV
jgi:hypothetical protein